MRWQGQRIDDTDETALPGFENRSGFLRSVTTPEFDGMTFHEVLAKSALNHVPGPSKMPFSWTINPYRGCSHACVYCVDPRTLILCADGTQRRLSDLSVGDEIIGTRIEGSYRRYTRTRIKAKWHTRKKAYRVTLADGTELEASGDHRFLTDRGWKHVADAERGQRPHLTLSNRLLGFGIGGLREAVATEHAIDDDRDYRLGYLSGMTGGLPTRMAFFAETRPAITRKLSVEGLAVKTAADLRVVSIDPLPGERDLVDITTGTGDFIANGVISHNCFARGTHTYLDLDAGRDFDTQIVVKVNVAEVLERELRRGSWHHETVALGTNTDPYQRAEGRYRLMPGILRTLAESGTPFSVLTKGTLIRRDIPELVRASADVPVDVQMSIAMFDEGLRRAIEPGAPTTQARLDTVRALSDAGFRVGVFLMPIMPHLTDSVAAIDDALRRIAAAGADHVIHGALHLRPGVKPWFFQWLSQHRPDLLSSYRALYPGVAAEAPKAYRQWLAKRVRPLVRVHGLTAQHSEDRPRRRSFAEPPRHDASATTPPKPATPAAPMLF
ncbi:Rv2578c family radical SAM protein [Microbacterium resistens]|uniref:Rv2578c family radical SAM protein n=1 Tax=Microbacterium resistens TaxID=156977 RepID=UPI000A675F71|nr:Rv2578c family radical SAM protein [Microbacterium resistens]